MGAGSCVVETESDDLEEASMVNIAGERTQGKNGQSPLAFVSRPLHSAHDWSISSSLAEDFRQRCMSVPASCTKHILALYLPPRIWSSVADKRHKADLFDGKRCLLLPVAVRCASLEI